MKFKLACFSIIVLISSCKYNISEESLKYFPYKEGDVLIFQSDKNEKDTLTIFEVESYYQEKNEIRCANYSFNEKEDSLYQKQDTVLTFFTAITRWENDKTVFSSNLNNEKAKFYPFNAKTFS